MTGARPPAPPLSPSPRPAPSSNGPAEPQPGQRRAFAEALSRHAGKRAGKEPLEDMGGAFAASSRGIAMAAGALAGAPTAAGDVDPALHAQLDRIAAAIAELARNGAEAEVHLSLPLGAYRVEGAVLGRDLAGQLNVLLIPAGAVPPAVGAQWAEQLNERLVRRELRVGKVRVQGAERRLVSPA